MNALARHLWRTRPMQIAAASYLDCHVKGLHSLLFIDAPGSVVRMFVTTPDHEMASMTGGGVRTVAAPGPRWMYCARDEQTGRFWWWASHEGLKLVSPKRHRELAIRAIWWGTLGPKLTRARSSLAMGAL